MTTAISTQDTLSRALVEAAAVTRHLGFPSSDPHTSSQQIDFVVEASEKQQPRILKLKGVIKRPR